MADKSVVPKKPQSNLKSNALNFLIGGLSGMCATSVIQPVDMVKVRIQVKSEHGEKNLSPFTTAKEIIKNEGGVKALYRGIDSALLRQAVYATMRLGLYFTMSDHLKARKTGPNQNLTGLEKAGASLAAGAIGSFIGNPFDLALVRMQSDATLPLDQRRNYKNVFDALYRVVKEEGVLNLWRGATPTIARAMSLNLAMLATYDEAKERLEKVWGASKTTLLVASAISGLMTSVVSLPFDNMKTKLQKMKTKPDGTKPYNGIVDCFKKSAAREGVTGLWAGLPTYYFRVAPHAMITLLVSEFLRKKLKGE